MSDRNGATLRNTLRRLAHTRAVLTTGEITVSQLAKRLGVSRRTVRRDLDLLREFFGAPIRKAPAGSTRPIEVLGPWRRTFGPLP